jgi:ParB-like chromosome segregation protein Spo0J
MDDRRFMSRLNLKRSNAKVQRIIDDIQQHGQLAPVGLARFKGAYEYVVIYCFTRTEAMRRLGRSTIRANFCRDLDEEDTGAASGHCGRADRIAARAPLHPVSHRGH